MKKYTVGILGATGIVGQRFVSLLENHPWFKVKFLAASKNSASKTYVNALNGKWSLETKIPSKYENVEVFDVINDAKKICETVDFVFCAISMKKSEIQKIEEIYAKFECPVISNNSAHRFTKDVPVIIPEINPEHVEIIEHQRRRLKTKKGFIVAKPNCSLQCFVPAIYPLFEFEVENVLVSTYQSISGAGKTFKTFPEIIDNIIPFIDGEEEKTEKEPLKIFGRIVGSEIQAAKFPKISSQCYRVPVSNGHTAAVFVKFNKKSSFDEIISKWQNFVPKIQKFNLPSATKNFLHYFSDKTRPQIKLDRNLENAMAIAIGGLRKDTIFDVKFVCMSHNIVRGAAGGAILTAELLCYENFI